MASIMQKLLMSRLLRNTYNFKNLQKFSDASEALADEVFNDLFECKRPEKYRALVVKEKDDIIEKKKLIKKKKTDVIIRCKRPEYDHVKNQKYDKFKPITLASQGWTHKKSVGDYFFIHVNPKDYDANSYFWDENIKDFDELKIDDILISALDKSGFARPTKIQVDSFKVLLSGKNALIAAETGCGKTLAYLIPILQNILKWKKESTVERKMNSPLAVIICPSRELAIQIGNLTKELSYNLPLSSHTIIGGNTRQQMMHPTFKDVDLLIGSLGVISKLTSTGIYNMEHVKFLVLDEADTLLDDSFSELAIRFINKIKVRYSNDRRSIGTQLTLVSATLPSNFDNILSDVVEPSSIVRITSKNLHRFLPHVRQNFHKLASSGKAEKLIRLATNAVRKDEPTIIFSNKSSTCDWISLMLNENNLPAVNLNGEMPVVIREGKYQQFINNEFFLMSCTDIASRGMDTKHVKHVINYDFPLYMADYIHRCGRTGRCGSPGDCLITNFVSGEREVELVRKIEMAVRTMDNLPNVNSNITKIIQNRINKRMNKN